MIDFCGTDDVEGAIQADAWPEKNRAQTRLMRLWGPQFSIHECSLPERMEERAPARLGTTPLNMPPIPKWRLRHGLARSAGRPMMSKVRASDAREHIVSYGRGMHVHGALGCSLRRRPGCRLVAWREARAVRWKSWHHPFRSCEKRDHVAGTCAVRDQRDAFGTSVIDAMSAVLADGLHTPRKCLIALCSPHCFIALRYPARRGTAKSWPNFRLCVERPCSILATIANTWSRCTETAKSTRLPRVSAGRAPEVWITKDATAWVGEPRGRQGLATVAAACCVDFSNG